MGLINSQIRLKELVPLCRKLATAYDAGIPILRSFEMIRTESRDPMVREVIGRMEGNIRHGMTLADAARAESTHLPPNLVESLAAGEMGGRLDAMFHDLAGYFEDRLAIRRKVVTAMAYPLFVLTLAWFAGTFAVRMMRQLIPSVMSKAGVPDFTFEGYLANYAWFQAKALIVALVVAGICVLLARAGALGWIWGAFSTHVWPFAPVTKRFALARFFRSMSLLISGGLPIDKCIERSAQVAGNPYIARDLMQAVPLVKRGNTLADAFAGCSYMLPTAREMLIVGEESGGLDVQLRKASQYFLEEASHAVNLALSVLGGVLVLVVACLVGYFYITFFLSYYGGMLDAIN